MLPKKRWMILVSTLKKAAFLACSGPNGAGKTTLLRMITGIFYPDSGNIQFDGKAFDPLNDIIKIGYMPEERGLYKKMKIGETGPLSGTVKRLIQSRSNDQNKILV